MQSTDKFLMGIVIGVVVLAGAVFLIALLRPDQPASHPDDTPEGVALSYVLAVQLMDYERAYGYLSPDLPRFPVSADAFADDVEDFRVYRYDQEDNISLVVDRVRTQGDRATVSLMQIWFERSGLFDSGERTSIINVDLRLTDDGWKVASADRYWDWCWSDPDQVPCKAPPAPELSAPDKPEVE